MRIDMEFPVLIVNLLFTALLQEMVPVTPWLPVKLFFLTALSLYAALAKPLRVALATAVLAGGFNDLLGGIDPPCTSCFLLAMVGITSFLKRSFLRANILQGLFLVAVVSVFQGIWTLIWTGNSDLLTWGERFARWGALFPAGMIAGGVGFAWCGFIDLFSGLTQPAEEEDGIRWTKTDR